MLLLLLLQKPLLSLNRIRICMKSMARSEACCNLDLLAGIAALLESSGQKVKGLSRVSTARCITTLRHAACEHGMNNRTLMLSIMLPG